MRNRSSQVLLDFVAGGEPQYAKLLRMFKHIIVPVDGSDCSSRAANVAGSLARELGAECILCVAVDVVAAAGYAAAAPDLVDAWLKTLRDQARTVLEETAARLRKTGVDAKIAVADGYPAEAILQFAKNHRGDLIVMGSHGRSGLRRFFLGSVAETVVRSATIPVLIVR